MGRVGATSREAAPDRQHQHDDQPPGAHPLGDQEILVLAWFSASSMQDPEVRARLWAAWGMCPRHSLGFVAVEASIYHGWLFAPAILYEDLMERAAGALEPRRVNGRWRTIAALQPSEPCLLCADGLTAAALDALLSGRVRLHGDRVWVDGHAAARPLQLRADGNLS
jgi:hypothetical protein